MQDRTPAQQYEDIRRMEEMLKVADAALRNLALTSHIAAQAVRRMEEIAGGR